MTAIPSTATTAAAAIPPTQRYWRCRRAWSEITFVRSVDGCANSDVVIVDLARFGDEVAALPPDRATDRDGRVDQDPGG